MTSSQTRPVRLWMLTLPVVLALVVIIAIVLAIVLPDSPLRLENAQLTIVGETILIIMVLCPLVLCMIIPYGLLVVAVFFMQKAHNNSSRLLDRARSMIHTAAEKTVHTADAVSQKSITMNTRTTFLSRLLHVFDRPNKPEVTDERSE